MFTISSEMECLETPSCRVHLYPNGTSIPEIAAERTRYLTEPKREDPEDPFFIFDLGDVLAKDEKWAEQLPNVEPFYAVKCNPDPVIISMLIGLGRGFDCASKKEIDLVLNLGGSPDRIIFAHPFKQESHLRFAKEKSVQLMTFDTEEELHKISRVHPQAELVLRVRYEDASAQYTQGLKFGCHKEDVRPLMECARDLGLNIVGISFQISMNFNNSRLHGNAIRFVRTMFDTGTDLGFDMRLLDIGGGFPGRLQPKTTMEEFAEAIRESLQQNFPAGSGVRVIAEPGRFFTRSAGYLVSNIIGKRMYKPRGEDNVFQDELGPKNLLIWMYYLNTGRYNGFRVAYSDDGLFKLPQLLSNKETGASRQCHPSTLWGPTGDVDDVISMTCSLPEMEAGDFLIFQGEILVTGTEL